MWRSIRSNWSFKRLRNANYYSARVAWELKFGHPETYAEYAFARDIEYEWLSFLVDKYKKRKDKREKTKDKREIK